MSRDSAPLGRPSDDRDQDDARVLSVLDGFREVLRHVDTGSAEQWRKVHSDEVGRHRRKLRLLELLHETARSKSTAGTQVSYTFRLKCPHCLQSVEIVDDGEKQEAACPECAGKLLMAELRTCTWTPEELQTLTKFKLAEPIGHGAFGTVFRGHDTELDRVVAVKVPHRHRLASRADAERFIREARSVAQLRHPGIIPVHDVGRTSAFPYIVSEYVAGHTLADALTKRGFTFKETADLIAQVAEAVDHAHQQGVVHRDLKPSNVMLIEARPNLNGTANLQAATNGIGRPRLHALVMDFGLARREGTDSTMTLQGEVLGTPAYMSPEQARGDSRTGDLRSDVYSLGVILYELLTGNMPFEGNRDIVLNHVLNDDPRPPRRLNDRIPRDLETVCLKAMAKEPARRYQGAGDLAADLRCCLAGEPIQARPVCALERAWKWVRRHKVITGLAAAVVMVAMIASWQWVSAVAARNDALAAYAAESEARQAEARAKEKEERRARQLVSLSSDNLSKLHGAIENLVGSTEARKLVVSVTIRPLTEIATEGSDNPHVQRLLAIAYSDLGDIQYRPAFASFGDLKGALASYLKSLDLFESLHRQARDDVQCRRDLARICVKLAAHYRWMGLKDLALQYVNRALDLQLRLVGDFAQEPEYEADLADSYGTLGDIYDQLLGKHDEAEDMYRQALQRYERLKAGHPEKLKYARNWTVGLTKLGDLRMRQRRPEEAMALYEQVYEDRKKAAEKNPQDGLCQQDLAGICDSLSTLHLARGELDMALERNDASIAVSQSLAQDQANFQAQRQLSRGSLARSRILFARKEPQAALDKAREVLALREKLAQAVPSNPHLHLDCAQVYELIGDVLDSIERRAEAEESYKKAIETVDTRVLAEAGHPVVLQVTASHLNKLGDLQKALRNRLAATATYSRALQIRESLAKADPSNKLAQYAWAASCVRVASVTAPTNPETALELLRIAQRLGFFRNPDDVCEFKEDPDLEAVRSRADYQQFITDLETALRQKTP